MSPAEASLLSLLAVIAISSVSKVNVGVIALAFAWAVGLYFAGLPAARIAAGFPSSLFLLLFGVTLLFGQIQMNGTLDRLAGFAMRAARGRRPLIPVTFFFMAAVFSAIGPGNIAAVALLAPFAMAVSGRLKIGAFLTAAMVVSGANAGTFSPLAPTGLIANGLAGRIGLQMDPWSQVFVPNFIAQSVIALATYVFFGGVRLWVLEVEPGQKYPATAPAEGSAEWARPHGLSIAAIAILVAGVTIFKADAGFLSITLAALLALFGSKGSPAAEARKAISAVPWDAIIMVCGVSTLVAVLESTGGMARFAELLARASTPHNVTGIVAFATGLLSVFSSSSGVIMPAFIPAVPGLAGHLPGADPAAIVAAINVGSHVVDVSPLSTLGALCLASAPAAEDRSRLFRNLLIYGISLSLFGAAVCRIFL